MTVPLLDELGLKCGLKGACEEVLAGIVLLLACLNSASSLIGGAFFFADSASLSAILEGVFWSFRLPNASLEVATCFRYITVMIENFLLL